MFRRMKAPNGVIPVAGVAAASSSGALSSGCCGGPERCRTIVLVLCAHLCLFFGIGISTSLTVFLDDIVQEFDSSITTLGIFFSVRALTFGVTSPLASFLAKRFGSRVVIMAGGLLTGAGVLMIACAKSVAMVGVGVVCLTGIGSALVYISTLIAIRRNFPNSRSYALANGITVSGSSLAVSVFAPITRVLSDTFNWRGSLLISSAVILHTMVFGALMRDRILPPTSTSSTHTHSINLNDSTSAVALIDDHARTNKKIAINDSISKRNSISKDSLSSEDTVIPTGKIPLANGEADSVDGSRLGSTLEDSESHEMLVKTNGHASALEEAEDQEEKESIFADKPSTILHGLLLFVIFLSTSSYSAVFVYLAAAGTERGLTPIEAAGLLSATGISQAVVRFGHGFLVTCGCIQPLPLFVIVQFIMTIGILVLGVFQQYSVGIIAAIMFGIGTGSVRSLNLVVQREVDKRAGSKAVGILVLVSEVAAAIGGLFAGLLRDRSGEYLSSFMVACGMTFAATLLSIVITILKRYQPCRPKAHTLPET